FFFAVFLSSVLTLSPGFLLLGPPSFFAFSTLVVGALDDRSVSNVDKSMYVSSNLDTVTAAVTHTIGVRVSINLTITPAKYDAVMPYNMTNTCSSLSSWKQI